MWPDPDVAAAAADTPDSKQSPDDDICVFACWPTSQDRDETTGTIEATNTCKWRMANG